jgi:hypothetical protein
MNDPAALAPLFAYLGWPPKARLVCKDWRYAYDKHAPRCAAESRLLLKSFDEVQQRYDADETPEWLGWSVSLRVFDARITSLRNVHTLYLWQCGVRDVSTLGSVHTLDLRYCPDVRDVSALGNVHTLNLSFCTGVRDVSALGNVHTLDLTGCTGVSDVSALGNVHTLYLGGCTGVRDVSALGNVHTLYLTGCTGVRDVSALGNVMKLTFP